MAKSTPNTAFAPLGHGVTYAIEGKTMLIRVDLDPAHAAPSQSGKMALCGNTGGWQNLVDGIRANIMVGRRAVKAA